MNKPWVGKSGMQKNEPSFMNTARFSEGVPLDGATSDAGVCFEGSPENAEMRCQSAAGEIGPGR